MPLPTMKTLDDWRQIRCPIPSGIRVRELQLAISRYIRFFMFFIPLGNLQRYQQLFSFSVCRFKRQVVVSGKTLIVEKDI